MIIRTLSRCSRAIACAFYLLLCREVTYAFTAADRVDRSSAGHFYYTSPNGKAPDMPVMAPKGSADMKVRMGADGLDGPEKVAGEEHGKKKRGGGPTQPEMQSFQSVNSNNMVDLFSGDFSYNIPLLDVGGYPVNLHYQSGITMDQEASWVGLGWNINPGTITRNMRGLPDDFNGTDRITKTVSMKDDRTVGVTAAGNVELVGYPIGGNLGLSLGVFHNTYKGWGTETGVNAGINSGTGSKGQLSGNLSITNNSQTGLDVSPTFAFSLASEENKSRGTVSIGTNYNSRTGIQNLQLTAEYRQGINNFSKDKYSGNMGTAISSYISFATPSYTPQISIPFTSSQFTFKGKVGGEAWALHPSVSITGYASVQKIAPEDQTQALPAYGYMYYQNAGANQHVLLDFNRDKEVTYRENVPTIGVPSYTYDAWSISGEGTGGMFRPYRGDIGYIFDHAMSTKSNSTTATIDLGFGNVFHGGTDINQVDAGTQNGAWTGDNILKDVIGWKKKDSIFENVYFKNPGEKTLVNQAFYDAIGDANLVRVDLDPLNGQNAPVVTATRNLSIFKNAKFAGRTTLGFNTLRQQRDKRNQLISYLTAEQARVAGLDKVIKSYYIDSFPCTSCNNFYETINRIDPVVHQPHHVSEITVTNTDGRRYVYGIPVYNTYQVNATFATNAGTISSGLVTYNQDPAHPENSVDNNRGKDNYFNKEETPPYAHSYLLSGILSPDYIDITGDGISEDDQGEAIKFNYSRVCGPNNYYQWRAPFAQNKASYNEGLKTDNRDERGSYSYGKREVWYLNSVESKNMIATFTLEKDTVRKDGYDALNENGGRSSINKLYRLRQIDLYAKADVLKNGIKKAKAIKTVHFDYDYSLCMLNPTSNSPIVGKLTLRRVWFTYNNNNKGKLNPYVFTYHQNNPPYNNTSCDRWGNYKSPALNPGTPALTNIDYSYALQPGVKSWDSVQAATAAAAWSLTGIKLPSGGRINVTYESDDYAYVQNRRAMQFFQVLGFGATPTSSISTSLYSGANNDYRVVFIKVPVTATDRADIARKYLDGVSRLYFKLFVSMPPDRWGSGSEFVPCFGDIEDYGVAGPPANNTIWIRVAPVNGHSPMAEAAIQFLRLNLPSKAYPFSEPGDNVSFGDVIKMVLTAASNVTDAIKGFDNSARKRNWGNSITTDKSFVRLDNPGYNKLGGGLRVKRVELYDNWNAMTGGKKESVYGQEYDYSTTQMINGVPTRISSGVASYEPAVGKDESPFYQPIEYIEKTSALAPTNFLYTEEPLQESFFPSPMVGYRKVRVQTINKSKASANGLEETEFYTAYDFPTITEFTPLDIQSKKTFNPVIANYLKINAKHDVTLSQGFRIELNDMNGKMKSQSSYAQTDLANPTSYTVNYYKLDNDRSGAPHLSNTVTVADSANGGLTPNAQIGKDIEMMVDLREQTSTTSSGSVEVNVDFMIAGIFPISLGSFIPFPTSERNRFRSVAVMKVVQRYGILDSVVHFDKGSLVSTRNLVYDGETGDPLVSKTVNAFDDPVYSFTYPAHWAYSGMEPAYKNIGSVFGGKNFRLGKMYNRDGSVFPAERYFEGGDELLIYGRANRITLPFLDTCMTAYYFYIGPVVPQRAWAVDVSKGMEGYKGIYFIDQDGKPFSGTNDSVVIIRSGKRNMAGIPIGGVTSLQSPIRGNKIVIDSTSGVLAANAAQFKDFWRTDSSFFRKDTTMILPRLADTALYTAAPVESFGLDMRNGGRNLTGVLNTKDFMASSNDLGGNGHSDYSRKTWLKWDLWSNQNGVNGIPQNAVIKSSRLYLFQDNVAWEGQPTFPDLNNRNTATGNSSWLMRTKGPWVADLWKRAKASNNIFVLLAFLAQMRQDNPNTNVDQVTRVSLSATPFGQSVFRNDTANITTMTQAMVDDYYRTGGAYPAATLLELQDVTGARGSGLWSQLAYYTGVGPSADPGGKFYWLYSPFMNITYCLPCQSGVKPTFSSTPVPGYYCLSKPVDTFVCKPNITDLAVNPYRWGILGNWRMSRAYVYYNSRNESDASQTTTNIRTDGQIKSFFPYWSFGTGKMQPSQDSSRWVWNSQQDRFNLKGFEIEDHDPLGRWNSGQYGYNQNFPVAVTQNSKNREMMYDGFEDYGYKTDTCRNCPAPRFEDLTKGGGTLVDTSSHTGLYSLRLGGNQTANIPFQVVSVATDTTSPTLSMKVDSTALVHTSVTGKGHGLKEEYFMMIKNPLFNGGCGSTPLKQWTALASPSNVDFDLATLNPRPFCPNTYFFLRWTGAIQPRYDETYTFYVQCDDAVTITINDGTQQRRITTKPDPVDHHNVEGPHTLSKEYETDTITLKAGKLYNISIQYTQTYGPSFAHMSWSSNSQAKEIVPLQQLYLPTWTTSDTTGSVKKDTTWCVALRNVKGTNVQRTAFSPIQSTKMLVSAWVKEDIPCISGSYANEKIVVSFNTGASFTLKPTGNIIEGWQRVEDTVLVPATAVSMTFSMQTTSGTPVFFDDIRVHPFNADMKSYVYNPVSLRLMAELDGNNYATFYEYDDDGTLIRVKKETERGIMTIKETRSALLKDQ